MSSHVQFACIIEHGADIQSDLKCDDSKIYLCHIVIFLFTQTHLVITQVLNLLKK